MSVRHTRESIFKELRKQAMGCNLIYKMAAVNRQGLTDDESPEKMTETVARFIIENFASFVSGIKKYFRENYSDLDYPNKPYRTASHVYGCREKRIEEKEIAYKLFEACEAQKIKQTWSIGQVLDYEIPLNERKGDSIGKIDLVSKNGDTLYILELKKPSSDESMLRCILEAYTYYLSIGSIDKFISSFDDDGSISRIAIAPLIFRNESGYGSPWRNITSEKHDQLLKLIDLIQTGTPDVKGVPVEIMCIDTGKNTDEPKISVDAISKWSITNVQITSQQSQKRNRT